jgi:hypothetical protein
VGVRGVTGVPTGVTGVMGVNGVKGVNGVTGAVQARSRGSQRSHRSHRSHGSQEWTELLMVAGHPHGHRHHFWNPPAFCNVVRIHTHGATIHIHGLRFSSTEPEFKLTD